MRKRDSLPIQLFSVMELHCGCYTCIFWWIFTQSESKIWTLYVSLNLKLSSQSEWLWFLQTLFVCLCVCICVSVSVCLSVCVPHLRLIIYIFTYYGLGLDETWCYCRKLNQLHSSKISWKLIQWWRHDNVIFEFLQKDIILRQREITIMLCPD